MFYGLIRRGRAASMNFVGPKRLAVGMVKENHKTFGLLQCKVAHQYVGVSSDQRLGLNAYNRLDSD